MIRKGTNVQWKWGSGIAKGKVIAAYTTTITKNIKGSKITRNGEKGNKALYIEQKDGDTVLKLENEVSRTKD